ncbi:hypothetical protein KAH37_09020 [bacterium]|nr:hypothetical protein [bacterium]
MKKGLFAVSLLLFLIYFSVDASTYSWVSNSLFGSSMRPKSDKKQKSHMRKKKASPIIMRWNFHKGQVNPTIKFFDMSNRGRKIHGSVKLQNNTSVSVRCIKGHKICFGGNFNLMGEHYTIGCGESCRLYSRMSSSEKRYSCETCRKGTVKRKIKIKKR